MSDKNILFFEPICTHNIWGGTRLRDEFHYPVMGDQVGECWGISAHQNGDVKIKNGEMAGQTLSQAWKNHPEWFGNVKGERFPLLTKIIDAKDDLSIQVHPDDEYARVYENGSFGKTECWYVLDCAPNSKLVVGHNAMTRDELKAMIYEGRWNELIRQVDIKKGDFIQINSGTVHAIKGGIMVLETQQNSDITYRLYDYDRLSNGKPRELHIEQSINVITVPAASVENCITSTVDFPKNELNELYSCKYYQVFKLEMSGEVKLEQKYPFLAMSVCEGNGTVNGCEIKKGDHFILLHDVDKIELAGDMMIIASTVPVE
ncbi:MAG: mannose-6-phosphate isomerase, class I [Lachnospiraceae bacterium]